MEGPKAPKDAVAKKSGFYIMRRKQIAGSPQPDGSGVQFIYLDGERLTTFAKIAGNVTDGDMIKQLRSAEGFRGMVAGIGITLEAEDRDQTIEWVLQMYGKTDPHHSGTQIHVPLRPDGMEHTVWMNEISWSEDDDKPGQMRFVFARPGGQAVVDVKLYLHDGYLAPQQEELCDVHVDSPEYRAMIEASLMQTGNPNRLKRVLDQAKRGEEVTLAFIGGSITQGAGAIPPHTSCYAYQTYEQFCKRYGMEETVRFIGAGLGGTSSELGMIRYERDVMQEGLVEPDLVVVEFAVNDEGDETKGECYESLVRRILMQRNAPAVILLFAVFANDWNLQERMVPIGELYGLPMVSVRDAVVSQFYKTPEQGRVLSKSRFFYDAYHPTNMGHKIMADCLLHLMVQADAQKPERGQEKPAWMERRTAFENIRLLDRHTNVEAASIRCGDFSETDRELQADSFPYNWMHRQGSEAFHMTITCASLILIFKDSGEIRAGKAQVLVDGEPILTADPRVNGWIHANAVIVLKEKPCREYTVDIRMAPGDEEKEFTILGFGFSSSISRPE